jgi:CheY-like chemotaxis protein
MMAQSQQRSNIVIIEDNPADILLVREALDVNEVPCSLEIYDTGESALAALAKRGNPGDPAVPSLVILDWNLPIRSGAEVLQAIRRWPQFHLTPIAVLTSSGSPRDRSQAIRLGATRYIHKPMDFEDFMRQVGGEIRELLNGGSSTVAGRQSS